MNTMHPIKIIAHRGYHKDTGYKENSIEAFNAAVNLKVDMIELDIHETNDGEFVVFHDDLCPFNGLPWHQVNYKEISASKGALVKPPTLSECIPSFHGTPINLEIKSYKNVDNLAKHINIIPRNSVISSFNLSILHDLAKVDINYPLLLIISKSQERNLIERFRASAYLRFPSLVPKYLSGLSVHYKIISVDDVKRIKMHELLLYLWTVDREEVLKGFLCKGIDGVITNNPYIFIKALYK